MKIIGLTGGIGSGKSTVSAYLLKKGYPVVDADAIARQITEKGSPVLLKLADAFGADILFEDGGLDRKKLGRLAFSSEASKYKLEEITHEEIFHRIREQLKAAEQQGNLIAFLDAPLLFETGLDEYAQQVWVVDAEDSIRVKRVMERDGLSEPEIWDRIKNQMPRQEKNSKAHEILDNSGQMDALYERVNRLLERI